MSNEKDTLVSLKTNSLSVSGDFWGERFSQLDKVRFLATLFESSTRLDVTVKNVLNRALASGYSIGGPRKFLLTNSTGVAVPEWNSVTGGLNLVLSPLAPDNTLQVNIYAPDGTNVVYASATNIITFRIDNPSLVGSNFSNFGPLYYVDIRNEGVVPISVLGVGVKYFLGLDYDFADGYLIFRRSPIDLFPDHYMIMEATVAALEYPLGYVSGTGPFSGYGYWVSRFLRSSQSVVVLERALNEIAGRVVLDSRVTINKVIPGKGGYSYYTDAGVIHARYKHSPLVVGATYPAGYIISPVVKCFSRHTAGDRWFAVATSQTDVEFPVSLLFPGVVIPKGRVTCELDSFGFVNIALPGPTETVEEWNSFRELNEFPTTSISAALSSHFSMEVGVPMEIDLLTFLMEQVWGNHGVVIAIKEDDLLPETLASLREFIDSHKLVNSVTLLGKWLFN
jgi:hypothetical protein